ncbi:MAG: efflux RND transporter periplasmic adaptor subunit [bacterium]
MKKKTTIIIISAIVIIIGIIFIVRSQGNQPTYQAVEVKEGEVNQIVSLTGSVTSAKEIDLQFEYSGKIESVDAEVGDKITEGQLIMRLNTAELNAQLTSSIAALEVAEAQLSQTLSGNRPEDIQVYKTAVTNAETSLENARRSLIDAEQDTENDLKKEYENAIDVLNDSYNKSSDAVYKQMDDLFNNDDSSPDLSFKTSNTQIEIDAENQRDMVGEEMDDFYSEISILGENNQDSVDLALVNTEGHLRKVRDLLDVLMDALNNATNLTSTTLGSYKANITTARTNINTALTNVTGQKQDITTTKITNQTNINSAQSAVDTAEASLSTAQDQLSLKKAVPLDADVDLAKARVKQAQANALQIREKINKMTLRSPIDGFVISIEKEKGETAQTNTPIVSLIAVDNFQIEANVSETDIAKVNLNDEVEMTLDALGLDEGFQGKIVKIDPAETVISGVIYYKITAMIDSRDERIKSGMTANLDIKTDKREDVLYLPYYAVNETNGRKYVKTLLNDEIVEKDVRTGLEGEVNIEIIDGLELGQKVITFSGE